MAQVTKGWYAEGFRKDETGVAQRVRSQVYHVRSAAEAFAASLRMDRETVPDTVNVRTKMGNEELPTE